MNKRVVVLHGHIFKNAGTSVDKILEQSFGSSFVDHRDDAPMIADKQDYLISYLLQNNAIRALSSHHLPMPMTDTPMLEFKTIVMLREPIVRIPSVYRFERQQDVQTPGAIAAKKYNMADYIRWRLDVRPGVVSDYFTKYLTTTIPDIKNAEIRFQQASNVLSEVFMVGIVEEFSAAVMLLNNKLRQYFPEFHGSNIRENITDSRKISQEDRKLEFEKEIGGQLYQRVLENNQYDTQIYQIARQRFDRELSLLI